MTKNETIYLALSLLPFVVLLTPYFIALGNKRRQVQKQTHIAVFVTFSGLAIGVFLVYQEYNPGMGMTAIIFLLWPGFAAAGGIPAYLITYYVAKYVLKKNELANSE